MNKPDFEIRPGLLGMCDRAGIRVAARVLGPNATQQELWLQLVPAVIAPVVVWGFARTLPLPWNGLQLAIAMLFAFDLTGGIITNATTTAKRWYHRPGQTFGDHFGFIAIHGLHLFLVAVLFRGGDWFFLGCTYSYLLLGAAIILVVSRDLVRPVALLVCSLGLLLNFYLVPPTVGLEWFLPFLWLKLFVSHLLPE
ncbi:MAG: hypothetical protein ACLFV6_03755 [Spirulinaceae cyanobacterium]